MKGILTLALSLLFLYNTSEAQQPITLPLLGQTDLEYTFKTAAAGDLDVELTGPDVVWDFSTIDPDSVLPDVTTQSYVEPANAPFINLIPNASFVLREEGTFSTEYTYLQFENDRLEVIAIHTEGDTLPIIFPDPILFSPIPLEFGFSESDTIDFPIDFFDQADTFQLTNSYVADGYGTLLLPGGVTFENVLRFGATSTINGLTEVEEDDIEGTVRVVLEQTNFLYLTNELGVPAASVSKGQLDVFLVLVPDVVEVPLFSFPTPLEIEYYQPDGTNVSDPDFLRDLSVFPNPTSDFVNVQNIPADYGKTLNWIVVDLSGRVVMEGEIQSQANEIKVDLGPLSTGIYHLVLTNGKEVRIHKVMKK